MQLECKFGIGDRVYIDGDRSISAVVIAVEWRGGPHPRYELSWLIAGDAKFMLFDGWRLLAADA